MTAIPFHAIAISGLKGIRIHDLRHTFASHFVMNGGGITELQSILDHSNIKTTLRYAHLAPEHLERQAEVVSFGVEDEKAKILDFSKTHRII